MESLAMGIIFLLRVRLENDFFIQTLKLLFDMFE